MRVFVCLFFMGAGEVGGGGGGGANVENNCTRNEAAVPISGSVAGLRSVQ